MCFSQNPETPELSTCTTLLVRSVENRFGRILTDPDGPG